jgi:hypothetical protein
VKEENVEKLPLYQCRKKVQALKIKKIVLTEYGAKLIPEDINYTTFLVNTKYIKKHSPQDGGYFVLYDDEYASFSPAKAFEDGYSLIEEG